MIHPRANKNFIAFLVLLVASTFATSDLVQSNHVIRRKGTDSNHSRSNIFRGRRVMELSRSILVHQVEAPHLICYNSTFPYLISMCDPGSGYHCSIEPPIFGCTKESNKSCNEVHMCNTPFEILISASIISITFILLATTGCLWCCCCCFCGKCCKNTCPWFAKIQMRPTVIHSPNIIYPAPPRNEWTMYDNDGNRTPDTIVAKSQKDVTMENQQNQFFDRNDFPHPNSSPSAPQMSNTEHDLRFNTALHTVPVYSPPRTINVKNGY